MARVAMAHAAAHRAADRVRLLFPVSSPPFPSSGTSPSFPPSLSSATDGKKYSAISGEASSGKLPITLTLVICSAPERVDMVGPFSLMENNIGAGGVQCWADVRSFPRMFRLCENSIVQDCSGSSTIFRRRAIAFGLPSHFPRIRYIYRAAKTSEKLPNTWENNEPVLCDCECLSPSPL